MELKDDYEVWNGQNGKGIGRRLFHDAVWLQRLLRVRWTISHIRRISVCNILLLFYGCKICSHIPREKHRWGCLRTKCWGQYVDWRERKWQEAGENYVTRSFIIITIVKVKENDMCGTCSTHAGHKEWIQNCNMNIRSEETAGATRRGPTRRVIFKWILQK
jgi:hypothetical protein